MTKITKPQRPAPQGAGSSLVARLRGALSFARLTSLVGKDKPAPGKRIEAKPGPTRPSAGAKDAHARPPRSAVPTSPAAARSPAAAKRDSAETQAEAEGRRRERDRCAAIILSAAGQRNLEMAKQLAFETRMTRKEAIALLEATPAPAPRGSFAHPERAANNPRHIAGGGSLPVAAAQASGRSWDRAFASAKPTGATR